MKDGADRTSEARDEKQSRVRTWFGRILLTLILVILFMGVIAPSVLEAPLLFLFGWIGFLMRVVPEITLDWDMLGLAAICFTVILFLSHALIRASIRTRNQNISTRNASWKLQSTLALNLLVWLSFFIATAVAGLFQEIRWIVQNDEPFMLGRTYSVWERIAAKELALSIMLGVDADGKSVPEAAQEARVFHTPKFTSPSGRYFNLRAFYLVDSTNGFCGVIVFPKVVETPSKEDVHVFYSESGAEMHKRSELRSILTEPGISAVPLF